MPARNLRIRLSVHIPFVVMFIFACAAGAPAHATVPDEAPGPARLLLVGE